MVCSRCRSNPLFRTHDAPAHATLRDARYLAAAEVSVPEADRDFSYVESHELRAKAAKLYEDGGPGLTRDAVHAGTSRLPAAAHRCVGRDHHLVCMRMSCGWVVAPAEMYARASEEAFAAGDGRAGSEYAAKAEELLSAQS